MAAAAFNEMKKSANKQNPMVNNDNPFCFWLEYRFTAQNPIADKPMRIGSRICDAPRMMLSGYKASIQMDISAILSPQRSFTVPHKKGSPREYRKDVRIKISKGRWLSGLNIR